MKDLEYHFPAKEHTLPPEVCKPAPEEGRALHEHTPLPDDLKVSAPEIHQEAESALRASVQSDNGKKERQKRELLKRMAGLTAAAGVATVTLMNAAPRPSFSSPAAPSQIEYPQIDDGNAADTDTPIPSISDPEPTATPDDPVLAEKADSAFPLLGHLAPNEPAPGFGGADIGEEYIYLEDPYGYQVIYAGSKYTDTPAAVSGVSYDPLSNTLTLSSYSGGILNVNRMGNSFTVRLIGDNTLDGILVWGFFTGGSITITGNGSLTVNQNQLNAAPGIYLQAENGQACLMVDGGVTLDVYGLSDPRYGSFPAILINETSMEQGIYYLSPNKLTGGIRQRSGNYSGAIYDYTVIDPDTGAPSLHVTFSQ